MSVSDSPLYSELEGGYTVYQGTPKAKRDAGSLKDPLGNPGRGMEFTSSFDANDKPQRYGVDSKPEGFQSSFHSGKPMPGASSGSPNKGIMYLLSVYADKCSLNGIIFIKSSKYYVVKAIWTILLLAALIVMVLHLYELATKYYAYEKQSQVDLQFSNLDFPAVTFCNVNAMRKSKVDLASEKLQRLVDSVSPDNMIGEAERWKPEYEEEVHHFDENGEPVDDGSGSGSGDRATSSNSASNVTLQSRTTNFFDDYNFTTFDDTYVDEYEDRPTFQGSWEAESQPAAFDKINKQFVNLYNQETATVRQRMGHRIQDMLIQCSYAGRKCFQRNFTLVASSTMGNCYTLQYSKFVARQSGPSQGLSLMLYLEGYDYVPGITNAIGLKVVVHEPDTVPFPDDEGMAVSAGMETNIALKKVSIARLGNPYGVCSDIDTFKETYGIKYTRQSCQQICEMEELIKNCNCYDATKPFIFTLLKNDVGVKSCQKMTREKVWCMEDVKWNFDTNSSTCHCSSPCEETVYRKTISSKPWPSTSFATLMAKTVCKEKNVPGLCQNDPNKALSMLELRENFVKVNIYYETLNFEVLTEQEDYTEFQFLSDIGGTVGLYVGLSVLSMFEVLHLLISIARYLICGNWKKNK